MHTCKETANFWLLLRAWAQVTFTYYVTGHEHGKRPEDSVQLACCLKVKEVTGRGVAIWNRRFCVLCGSRMFIFPSSQPKGKPNLAIDLRGGKISEYKSRRHIFCLRIMSLGREMLLSFESRFEQSKWLERAGNVRGLNKCIPPVYGNIIQMTGSLYVFFVLRNTRHHTKIYLIVTGLKPILSATLNNYIDSVLIVHTCRLWRSTLWRPTSPVTL